MKLWPNLLSSREARAPIAQSPHPVKTDTLLGEAAQPANIRCIRIMALQGIMLAPIAAFVGAYVYGGRLAYHQLGWHALMWTADLLALWIVVPLRRRLVIPTYILLASNAIVSGAATAIGIAFGGAMVLVVITGFLFVVLLPIPLVLHPRDRLRITLVMGALILFGFGLEFPTKLAPTLLRCAFGLLVVSLAFSFTIGWSVTALVERTYREQRRLTAEAESTAAEMRRLAARIDELREADRTHLARELHDELGSGLTAIRLVTSLPDDEARSRKLDHLLDDAHAALRRICAELRPPVLDEFGLAATVEWLVVRQRQITGANCHFAIEFGDDAAEGLDPVRATAVFRCLQESLTNVARHSCAKNTMVQLQRQGDELHVKVMDDGVGFDVASETPQGHYGLIGMRERALAVGGRLEIQSEPGRGTEIALHVPLTSPRPAAMEIPA